MVRPDRKAKNPAKPLMQRVAEAKKDNDPSSIPALKYDFYELLEVAVNDYPEKWPERRCGAHSLGFGTNWTPANTGWRCPCSPPKCLGPCAPPSADGKSASKRPEPPGSKTGKTRPACSPIPQHQPLREPLLLLDRAFTSPLHDRGNVHYRYYILDTLDRGGRPCFHMAFVPRRRGELTSKGKCGSTP